VLSSTPGFTEVSPDVGALDEAAFDELLNADPDAALSLIAELTGATDAGLRQRARRLAARLMIELARDRPPDAAGVGQFVSRRFRSPDDDIDVDRSLDELVESRRAGRPVRPDDLAARGWARRSTAWCLVVDRSGSMHGRPLATAALAAAALALRADRDEFAVLSFARDVVAPKAMWERRPVDDVVDRVLALRGHGTTDVAGALVAAGEQLRASSAGRRVTVVLSDCRATEPGDAVAAARALDELVILAPEGDDADARRLADAVGARCTTYAEPSSVVAAIAAVLDRA
jgi:Mg-chelatase subunit ChlD